MIPYKINKSEVYSLDKIFLRWKGNDKFFSDRFLIINGEHKKPDSVEAQKTIIRSLERIIEQGKIEIKQIKVKRIGGSAYEELEDSLRVPIRSSNTNIDKRGISGEDLINLEKDFLGYDYDHEKWKIAPEWDEWLGLPVVTLREAVYLSVNINPVAEKEDMEYSDWKKIKSRLERSFKNLKPKGGDLELFDEYSFYSGVQEDIYSDCVDETDIFVLCESNTVKLKDFYQWVVSIGDWDLPEELTVKQLGSDNVENAQETYSTKWLKVLNAAVQEFYIPRKEVDPRKDDVTNWIEEKAKTENIEEPSERIVNAMFTIIKSDNHDPRKKRENKKS